MSLTQRPKCVLPYNCRTRMAPSRSRQKKMVKSLVSSSPSMANHRLKLLKIVHRHDQMKAAFNNLRSQIKTGLIEAEDVFASLAIPLMKLVGLKTRQMAQEGRSSTIIMDPPFQQTFRRKASGSETPARPPFTAKTSDQLNRMEVRLEEEEGRSYYIATEAGKKLIEKQRLQLQQLVYLLRRIESHVNSHQENILQTLDDQRVYLQKLFQQSVLYLSSAQQSTHTDEAFLVVTLKLLRSTFQRVGSLLGSVQDGVENLMTELAEHMCNPMTDYVKSLKAEMSAGALIRLVAVVEEMVGVVKDGQTELEEARRKVRIEEERKLEALSRLKDAEEKRKAMKEFLGFLLEAKKRSKEPFTSQKFLVMDEDQAGDEKLLWDLLKEKNKVKAQASPLGTQELLHAEPKNKDQRQRGDNKSSVRIEPKVSHRPVTRSSTKGFVPETPCPDPWPHLGSSPSMVDQQHVVQKQISPFLHIKKPLHRQSMNLSSC